MTFSKTQSIILTALFCVMIATLFGFHFVDALRAGKAFLQKTVASGEIDFSNFEESYNERYADDLAWVDIYGLTNHLLGKREVSNFEVVKDYSNNLYVSEDRENRESPEEAAKSVVALHEKAQDIGAQFLFVQPSYKTYSDKQELLGYASSFLDSDYDRILESLDEYDISSIDLRAVQDCEEWYRTDHHWTCDAAFAATQRIVDELEQTHKTELLADREILADKSCYKRVEYPNSFLGSAGIKVGEFYAGKDDFSYLAPVFATNITYKHYSDRKCDKNYSGTFEEAFIDKGVLENPAYLNKYNAFLHGGYVESVIENHLAPNNLKVLLVSHSYGRPVAQYLSLYFAETCYLDPQDGRYNDDYGTYVENYDPDVVIVMYDGSFKVSA